MAVKAGHWKKKGTEGRMVPSSYGAGAELAATEQIHPTDTVKSDTSPIPRQLAEFLGF